MDAVTFSREVEALGQRTKTRLAEVLEAKSCLGMIYMQKVHEEGEQAARLYLKSQFIGLRFAWQDPTLLDEPSGPKGN